MDLDKNEKDTKTQISTIFNTMYLDENAKIQTMELADKIIDKYINNLIGVPNEDN